MVRQVITPLSPRFAMRGIRGTPFESVCPSAPVTFPFKTINRRLLLRTICIYPTVRRRYWYHGAPE